MNCFREMISVYSGVRYVYVFHVVSSGVGWKLCHKAWVSHRTSPGTRLIDQAIEKIKVQACAGCTVCCTQVIYFVHLAQNNYKKDRGTVIRAVQEFYIHFFQPKTGLNRAARKLFLFSIHIIFYKKFEKLKYVNVTSLSTVLLYNKFGKNFKSFLILIFSSFFSLTLIFLFQFVFIGFVLLCFKKKDLF